MAEDKANTAPDPIQVDVVVAKLRYMGRQYAAGQQARGGGAQKHYLEEAADIIDNLRAALERDAHTRTQPQAAPSAAPELVRAITELTGAVERLTLGASRIHARL